MLKSVLNTSQVFVCDFFCITENLKKNRQICCILQKNISKRFRISNPFSVNSLKSKNKTHPCN